MQIGEKAEVPIVVAWQNGAVILKLELISVPGGSGELWLHPSFAHRQTDLSAGTGQFTDALAGAWSHVRGSLPVPAANDVFWRLLAADGHALPAMQLDGPSASAAAVRAFWHVARGMKIDPDVYVLADATSLTGRLEPFGHLRQKIDSIKSIHSTLSGYPPTLVAASALPADNLATLRAANSWAEVVQVGTVKDMIAVRSCTANAVIAYMEHLEEKLDAGIERINMKLGLGMSSTPATSSVKGIGPQQAQTHHGHTTLRESKYRELIEGVRRGDPVSIGEATYLVLELQRTDNYKDAMPLVAEMFAMKPENEQADAVMSLIRALRSHERHLIPLIIRSMTSKMSETVGDQLAEMICQYGLEQVQEHDSACPSRETMLRWIEEHEARLASDATFGTSDGCSESLVKETIAELTDFRSFQGVRGAMKLLQERFPRFSDAQQERIIRHVQTTVQSQDAVWGRLSVVPWLEKNSSPAVRARLFKKS